MNYARMVIEKEAPEEYGYDRIRFIKPVFFGDTVTVEYRVQERNDPEGEVRSRVTVTNQHGEVVAAAIHILKLV